MKVIKIGGTALSNSKSINKFCLEFKNLTTPTIVVVSALGKLSSTLKNHFYSATNTSNFTPLVSIFTEYRHLLCQKYCEIFDEYTLQCQKKLTDIVQGCTITEEFSEKALDKILIFGELVTSKFIYCVLRSNNIDCNFLDIRTKIITNSNFGNASPDIDSSIENLSQTEFQKLTITQGFIASDKSGNDTTMGFESSNLSATLIAKAKECSEIEIYTNVSQIYMLDPNKYTTFPVDKIPYCSAKVLSAKNFKLLFPGMIELAEQKNIIINYKGLGTNSNTTISSNQDFDLPVIHHENDLIFITPLKKRNAMKLVNKFEKQIDDFRYSNSEHLLEIRVKNIDITELQEAIVSLSKKY